MNKNQQLEIAVDMIDFCEGLLLSPVVTAFWAARDYNLTDEDRKKVFLMAYSICMK